jgi:hypothetical protein
VGDRADGGGSGWRLAIFEVLEARVDYILHAVKLRPPNFGQVFEAAIDLIEPRVHVGAKIGNPCVHLGTKVVQAGVIHQDTDEHSERRNGDGHGGLKSKISHVIVIIAIGRGTAPYGHGSVSGAVAQGRILSREVTVR